MNQTSMERLKRQVKKMPDDLIKGYLDNAVIYDEMGFSFWTEVIEILRAEVEARAKENRE